MTAAGGCGLPVISSPQVIPAAEIPQALSSPSPPFATFPKFHDAVPVFIYLIDPDDQLFRVTRYLRAPLTPQRVLDALDDGPLPTELDQGIQSAIPPLADLVAGGLSGGVLTVLLDSTFGSLGPGQATYEFAQIVYSVTSLPAVHRVLFKYNGGEIEPEVGNGSTATNFSVSRADYQQLLAS